MHWPGTLPQFVAWKWYFLGETEMSKQLIGIICKPFVKWFGSLWICVDENRCNWRVRCFVWVVLKNEMKCIWQNRISRETRICFFLPLNDSRGGIVGLQVSEIHQQRCALLETGDKYMEYGLYINHTRHVFIWAEFSGNISWIKCIYPAPLAFLVLSIF